MKSYVIHLSFKGKPLQATVHKYDQFSFIYFSDSEIILEFGGQFEAGHDNKVIPQAKEGRSAQDLYSAIERQLR